MSISLEYCSMENFIPLACILAFSAVRPRQTYLHVKTAMDRMTGAVLGLLGTKPLSSLSL
jgi:hypothetical protein